MAVAVSKMSRKALEKELRTLRAYKDETLHRWVREDVKSQAENMDVELSKDELDQVCYKLEFPTDAVWASMEYQIERIIELRGE
jgi:hypothetical protein